VWPGFDLNLIELVALPYKMSYLNCLDSKISGIKTRMAWSDDDEELK
jgi:hypothetical protein